LEGGGQKEVVEGMKGGDVWLVLALMVTGVDYERDVRAIKEGSWRKGVSWVRDRDLGIGVLRRMSLLMTGRG
jgi:hypothetical protein